LFVTFDCHFTLGESMKSVFVDNSGVVSRPFRQRGASLLEGLAYLGIAAIVILGAVSLLSGAFGNAQANQANQEIVSLRTAARKLFASQTYPGGNGVLGQNLVTARAVPGTLTINGINMTNAWGGAVTVTGNGGAGGANQFTIAYASVPEDVCINIVSGATGWTQINRGGNNAIIAFPVTTAVASATCAAAGVLNFIAS
jgi:type II secretory pathway pseudopilin PulG